MLVWDTALKLMRPPQWRLSTNEPGRAGRRNVYILPDTHNASPAPLLGRCRTSKLPVCTKLYIKVGHLCVSSMFK